MCLFTRFTAAHVGPDALVRAREQCSPKKLAELHSAGRVRAPAPTWFVLVRNHPLHFRCIRIADQSGSPQLALALLVFRGQDVTQKRLRAFYFSCPSFLEALGGAFVCF
jgi:hypothetical protein